MDDRRVGKLTLALAGFLLVGFAAAGSALYVRPTARLQARAASLEKEFHDRQHDLEQRPRLQAAIAAFDSALALQERRLPSEPRLDDFVARAGAEARRCRVRIVDLQPGEPRLEAEFGVLPVRVGVQGDFERIYAWIVALEDAPRLVRATSVQAHLLQGSQVHTELQLSLYLGTSPPTGGR